MTPGSEGGELVSGAAAASALPPSAAAACGEARPAQLEGP